MKIIAVDFDGTLCESKYPSIGEPNRKLIKYLIRERQAGAYIILWTNRTGPQIAEAVNWCSKYNLHFDAVNENNPEIIARFGDSRKIYATEYIDDRSTGTKQFNLPFKMPESKV